MRMRPALGSIGLLSVLLSACQPAAPPQEDAERAILAQERRALEQWARGTPLGYLDIQTDDVTYFDDIGILTLRYAAHGADARPTSR